MSKLTLYLFLTANYLIVFVDLPIFFLFGVVYVGIMIETKKIEKKVYPILSNIFLSSIVGWAVSFGVKHLKPDWFTGNVKIFSMLLTTLLAYFTIMYLFKSDLILKAIERIFEKLTQIIENFIGKHENNSN